MQIVGVAFILYADLGTKGLYPNKYTSTIFSPSLSLSVLRARTHKWNCIFKCGIYDNPDSYFVLKPNPGVYMIPKLNDTI